MEHFNLTSPLQAPARRGAASLHGSAHPVHVCLCVYWGTVGKTQKARSQLWKHRGASGVGGETSPHYGFIEIRGQGSWVRRVNGG